MENLTVWQVDPAWVLMYECPGVRSVGWLQVRVAPPPVPAGLCAVWKSTLDPKTDPLWAADGTWELIEDHRKDELWLARGQQYSLGTEHNGQQYGGLGPLPAWLHAEEPAAPQPTLGEAKAARLSQINFDFERAASALTAGYPEAERLTWPIQQAEALAWAADNAAATPYLDGLAAARGISAEEMRQLTLAQVQAFQAASQQLVGTRQRLRDQINQAKTVSEVDAIAWPAS